MVGIWSPLALLRWWASIHLILAHKRVSRAIRAHGSRSVAARAVTREAGRSYGLSGSVLLELRAATVGSPAAGHDADEKETTETGGKSNDKVQVLIDPRADFTANRSALADTLR